jgi:DNA-binding phage protein
VEIRKLKVVILRNQKNIGGIMANRHRDFNELIATQFEDAEFAQVYITNLINEEDMELDEALRETIISMGLQAFADKADISIQYVSDFVKKRKKFSTESIDKYLQKAFALKIKVSVESVKGEVA